MTRPLPSALASDAVSDSMGTRISRRWNEHVEDRFVLFVEWVTGFPRLSSATASIRSRFGAGVGRPAGDCEPASASAAESSAIGKRVMTP